MSVSIGPSYKDLRSGKLRSFGLGDSESRDFESPSPKLDSVMASEKSAAEVYERPVDFPSHFHPGKFRTFLFKRCVIIVTFLKFVTIFIGRVGENAVSPHFSSVLRKSQEAVDKIRGSTPKCPLALPLDSTLIVRTSPLGRPYEPQRQGINTKIARKPVLAHGSS